MSDLHGLVLLVRTINPKVVVGNGPDDSAAMRKLHAEVGEALERACDGLEKIANGDGCYGAQALEYKNIAREVLGLPKVGERPGQ